MVHKGIVYQQNYYKIGAESLNSTCLQSFVHVCIQVYGGPVVHFSSSCISDSQLDFRFSSSCISDFLYSIFDFHPLVFAFRFSSTCIFDFHPLVFSFRFSSICILDFHPLIFSFRFSSTCILDFHPLVFSFRYYSRFVVE